MLPVLARHSRALFRHRAVTKAFPTSFTPSIRNSYHKHLSTSRVNDSIIRHSARVMPSAWMSIGHRSFASSDKDGKQGGEAEDVPTDLPSQSEYEDATLDLLWSDVIKNGGAVESQAAFWEQFMSSPVYIIGRIDGTDLNDESEVNPYMADGTERISYSYTTVEDVNYVPLFTKQSRMQAFSPLTKMPYVLLPGRAVCEILTSHESGQQFSIVMNPETNNQGPTLTLDHDTLSQMLLAFENDEAEKLGDVEMEADGEAMRLTQQDTPPMPPAEGLSLSTTTRDTTVINAAIGTYFREKGTVESASFCEVRFTGAGIGNGGDKTCLVIAVVPKADSDMNLTQLMMEMSAMQVPVESEYGLEDLLFLDVGPNSEQGNEQVAQFLQDQEIKPWYKHGAWKVPKIDIEGMPTQS